MSRAKVQANGNEGLAPRDRIQRKAGSDTKASVNGNPLVGSRNGGIPIQKDQKKSLPEGSLRSVHNKKNPQGRRREPTLAAGVGKGKWGRGAQR